MSTYRCRPCLVETHPHLLDEWDYVKNGILQPEDVSYGSHKKVWWVCKACGYKWEAIVYSRTSTKPTGCAACAGQTVMEKNNLAVLYPHLLEEWDFEKNKDVSPTEVTRGSGKQVWWKCKKCDCCWKIAVYTRTKIKPSGCPACSGRVCTDKNNLKVCFPSIAREWDYTKNEEVPDMVVCGSHKKVWWKCSKCLFSWSTKVATRTRLKANCPACVNQAVSCKNNMAVNYPALAKEWLKERNILLPSEVVVGADLKVWWKCSACGHVWKTFVYKRTQGSSCPVCARGSSVSKISQEWLDRLNIKTREYYIKDLGFTVDGFDPGTNTVYEFLGDFWHGNPDTQVFEDVNPVNKKSFGDLYKKTMNRLRLLEKSGYKVIHIWENDFNNKELQS